MFSEWDLKVDKKDGKKIVKNGGKSMDQAKKMAIKQAFWDREKLCRIKSDVPLIEELTQSRFLS